jgi:predicted MFS family arabinose efflux permease
MNPWQSLRGLPKEIWVLFSATLINRAGTMAIPFLALYLTRSLGFSDKQAGLTLAVYGIGALVTAPLAGWLCDRISPHLIMNISLILSGSILLTFPLVKSFNQILMFTLAWSVTAEAFRPANLTFISQSVVSGQGKKLFAINRLAINLGMSIGPALGGFLTTISFPLLFLVDGATSIVAGLVLTFLSTPSINSNAINHDNSDATNSVEGQMATTANTGHLIYFLIALIPILIVFFQGEAALPLFLVRDLGISEVAYGILFTLNTVLIIFLEVPLNLATHHWPHRRTLCLGAFLCALGFGALVFVQGFFTTAITVVIWTFGEMLLLPGSSAYVAEIAPIAKKGAYMGFYGVAFSLAFAIGSWLGTAVLSAYGAQTLWLTAFAAGCLSALMMLRVYNTAAQ